MTELGHSPERAEPNQGMVEHALELIARAKQTGAADNDSAKKLQQMFAEEPQFQNMIRMNIVSQALRADKLGESLEGFLTDSKNTLALMREAKMNQDQLNIYEKCLQLQVINTTAKDGMEKYLEAIEQVGFSKEQIVDGATSILASRTTWNIDKFSQQDVQIIADRTETPIGTVQELLMLKIADGRIGDAFLGIGYDKVTRSNALHWRMKLATTYGIPVAMATKHFDRIVDEVIKFIPTFLTNRRASGSGSGLIKHIKVGYEAILTEYPVYANLAQKVLDTLTANISPETA